jgi:hypothetical protein
LAAAQRYNTLLIIPRLRVQVLPTQLVEKYLIRVLVVVVVRAQRKDEEPIVAHHEVDDDIN